MSYFETTTLNDAILLTTVSSVSLGNSAAIDSTGFGSLVLQLYGVGTIEATIYGSNDGTNYDQVTIKSFDEYKPTQTIGQITSYFFDTSFRYYIVNVSQFTGTISYTILGRAQQSPSILDNIANALDPDTPLNINVVGGINKDSLNSIILSDGIAYPYLSNSNGQAT